MDFKKVVSLLHDVGLNAEHIYVGEMDVVVVRSEEHYFECRLSSNEWVGHLFTNDHEHVEKWISVVEKDDDVYYAFAIMRGLARWLVSRKPVPEIAQVPKEKRNLRERLLVE